MSSSSSSNSPCAACKFLRRKCTKECVFGPYFPAEQPQRFSDVHKVFGASNVSKILNDLDVRVREEAVNSLVYEAEARLRDPVYGCVGMISMLDQSLKQLHLSLDLAKKELASIVGPAAMMQMLLQPPNNNNNMNPNMNYHHLQQQQGFNGGGGFAQHHLQHQAQHMMMRDVSQAQVQQQQQQQQQYQHEQMAMQQVTEEQEMMRICCFEQQQQQQQQEEVVIRYDTETTAAMMGDCFGQHQNQNQQQHPLHLALGNPNYHTQTTTQHHRLENHEDEPWEAAFRPSGSGSGVIGYMGDQPPPSAA